MAAHLIPLLKPCDRVMSHRNLKLRSQSFREPQRVKWLYATKRGSRPRNLAVR
jgi:hypothetical protein